MDLDAYKLLLTQQLSVYRLRFQLITHERLLWTQLQIACLSGFSVRKVREAVALGELKAVKGGKVPRASVIEWIGGDPTLEIARTIISLENSLKLIRETEENCMNLPLSA